MSIPGSVLWPIGKMNGEDLAAMLERAIERSGKAR
jgi:hypothetical protein